MNIDDSPRQVAIRRVPGGINAERLDVDSLLVHRAQAFRRRSAARKHISQAGGIGVSTHERHGLRHSTMGMDVNGRHAASAHHNLTAARRRGFELPPDLSWDWG